jgi:hypothetical protein
MSLRKVMNYATCQTMEKFDEWLLTCAIMKSVSLD